MSSWQTHTLVYCALDSSLLDPTCPWGFGGELTQSQWHRLWERVRKAAQQAYLSKKERLGKNVSNTIGCNKNVLVSLILSIHTHTDTTPTYLPPMAHFLQDGSASQRFRVSSNSVMSRHSNVKNISLQRPFHCQTTRNNVNKAFSIVSIVPGLCGSSERSGTVCYYSWTAALIVGWNVYPLQLGITVFSLPVICLGAALGVQLENMFED